MKKINNIIILIFLNILISTNYVYSKNSNELYEKIDLFSEVLETIKKDYVDKIDQAEVWTQQLTVFYNPWTLTLLT